MNYAERQSAHDTLLEIGHPEWAVLIAKVSEELLELEAIDQPQEEAARLLAFIKAVEPTQSQSSKAVLEGRLDGTIVAAVSAGPLRHAAKDANHQGCTFAANWLNALASQLEASVREGPAAKVVKLQNRLRLAMSHQTNSEIRRWFSLALTPGSPVVSNTGERIV